MHKLILHLYGYSSFNNIPITFLMFYIEPVGQSLCSPDYQWISLNLSAGWICFCSCREPQHTPCQQTIIDINDYDIIKSAQQ